jgi:hypothetical protein
MPVLHKRWQKSGSPGFVIFSDQRTGTPGNLRISGLVHVQNSSEQKEHQDQDVSGLLRNALSGTGIGDLQFSKE